MLLVVTYSTSARTGLRNTCRAHEDHVVRRFGRAALFEATAFGAFLALRLQETYGADVQIERTEPFNEFTDVDEAVVDAARAYANRETKATPYAAFAAGTEYPDPDELKGRKL
ncbi:DUF7855 family protein [Halorubrum vacuolatum]|uniref:Uncharacterized protein n=1 Tax=Halorubrum vacuolatum TaxID=63740 RepID=A0A238WRT8_HALVU|nr:hypothetical protein [Halorubrum vacuolatum]SNR49033.1 hypothetical protein SAMN06264855_109104 [Halorubrum vacuolatum]